MNNELTAQAENLAEEIEDYVVAARRLGELIARGPGGREIALAITKLQEAQLWIRQACLED